METVLAVRVGLGLSATCGFRVFVPLLGIGIAAHSGYLTLASNFSWIGTWPAIIAFGLATGLEVAGYYLPWFDNLLDTIATPSAVLAGIIATASMVTDVSPFIQWSLAVIGGGGVAGVVQGGSVVVRGLSSTTTGGIGNPIVSTTELVGSILGTILAIVLPILAILALLLFGVVVYRWVFREKKKQKTEKAAKEVAPSGACNHRTFCESRFSLGETRKNLTFGVVLTKLPLSERTEHDLVYNQKRRERNAGCGTKKSLRADCTTCWIGKPLNLPV